MNKIQKGHQITAAFKYIQKVFTECQRLIYKLDNQMAPEWSTIYGSRITRDISSSLYDPDRWVAEAIFRIYENTTDKNVNKGITISFWGNYIDQPVITTGKIIYSDVSKRTHWDMWWMWYEWTNGDEKKLPELDGKTNIFVPEEKPHIKEAKLFSLPLVDIINEEALIEKIIQPLKDL